MQDSHVMELNNEMKRLIRSVVEVIIEEGYDVSVIAEEIYSTHKKAVETHNNAEDNGANFDEALTHEVEKKLWNMFTVFWPKKTTRNIRKMVIVCSTYICARMQGKTLNMDEIAILASKRINLKTSTIQSQITNICSEIANKFWGIDYYHKISSNECLDKLYKKYFEK